MFADWIIGTFMAFFLFAFALGGAELQGVVFVMNNVQNEAQVVAMSEGRYGGYNTVAESSVIQFAQEQKLDRSQVTVRVSAPGAPVPYGAQVTAAITVPFKFEIGSFMPAFTINLTGTGRSVSTYTPGVTPDVTYVSP